MVEKALEWLDADCSMVLVVDPEQRAVTVYRRSREDIRILVGGDTLGGAEVIPGFSLPVTHTFA